MNKKDIELFKNLCEANAIASNEGEVRDILVSELKDKVDDVYCDGIGSVIFQSNPNKTQKSDNDTDSARVMLAAHIDEVGWVVEEIDCMGHLILKTIGGTKRLAAFMQRVVVTTASGKQYKGFVQSTFSTTQSKNASNPSAKFTMSNLPGKTYVDLGLDSDKEVYDLGIQLGDMVTFDSPFETLTKKDIVMGKAIDDRVGCLVMANVIDNFKKQKHENTIFGVGTSSEEVGVRGAKTASETICPDVAIVIDTSYHDDELDRSTSNKNQIGKGPILVHGDKRCMPNKKMVALAQQCADDLGIKIQHDIFLTAGTDAGSTHLSCGGTPTVTICVPMRYGHAPYSIVNMKDVEQTTQLVTEMVRRLDNDLCQDMRTFI